MTKLKEDEFIIMTRFDQVMLLKTPEENMENTELIKDVKEDIKSYVSFFVNLPESESPKPFGVWKVKAKYAYIEDSVDVCMEYTNTKLLTKEEVAELYEELTEGRDLV